MPSNEAQVRNAYNLIASQDKRKIALLGLSFKAGTDDLRESPLVELAEMLIGKGFDLKIFDRNVEYARVHGANRDYIESKIPHVSSLLRADLNQVVADADVIVLGNGDELFETVVQQLPPGKKLIDLVNELHDGIQARKAPDSLAKVLAGLITYTATHFKHEEEFFAKTGYGQYLLRLVEAAG